MNPKYLRVADRIKALIIEGNTVATLERDFELYGPYIQDEVPLHSWLVKVENILSTVFGDNSAHYLQTKKVLDRDPQRASQVNQIMVRYRQLCSSR